MTTSVLMGCSEDEIHTRRETEMNLGGCDPKRVENGKRRKQKTSELTHSKKKQPQRGMGVAQLERLRLQERWKKMTQINLNPVHNSLPLQSNKQFVPSSAVTYGGGFGFRNMVAQCNQFARLVQGRENGVVGFNGTAVGVGPNLFSDHFLIDPSGIGSSNLGFQVGNVIETSSKELSSIPNNVMKSSPDGNCGVYHKKKRINGESMCNGERNMCGEMPPVNLFGNFKGNNVGGLINIDGANQYFGAKAGRCREQEPGVMAVHSKKGSTGGLLTEYEFFPGEVGKSSGINQSNPHPYLAYYDFPTCLPCSVGAAAATTNTADQAVDQSSNNSIDLSLKLSY